MIQTPAYLTQGDYKTSLQQKPRTIEKNGGYPERSSAEEDGHRRRKNFLYTIHIKFYIYISTYTYMHTDTNIATV